MNLARKATGQVGNTTAPAVAQAQEEAERLRVVLRTEREKSTWKDVNQNGNIIFLFIIHFLNVS